MQQANPSPFSPPTIEQTGAPSGNHWEGWGWRASQRGARQRLLQKLGTVVCEATPLTVLEKVRDRDSLREAILSVLGVTGLTRGLAPPNPFLGALEGVTPVEVVNLGMHRSEAVSVDEVERLFRNVLKEDLDSARSIVYVVEALPEGCLIRGVKQLLVEALREPNGARILNGWKSFVGVKPLDVDESERKEFAKAADAFMDYCDHIFDQVVEYLSDMAENKQEDLDDLLWTWRNVAKYYSLGGTREEVLTREGLIFDQIVQQFGSPVDWEKRKYNLDRIVRDPRFGLGEHLKLVEVEMGSAEDYSTWLELLRLAIKHADYYGLRFGRPASGKGPVKIQAEGKETSKKEESGGGPGAPNRQCFRCRKWGHISSSCPEASSLPTLPMPSANSPSPTVSTPGAARQCFRCGGTDHLVRDCHMAKATSSRTTLFTLAREPRDENGEGEPIAASSVSKLIPGAVQRRDPATTDERPDGPPEINMRIQDLGEEDASEAGRGRYLPGVTARISWGPSSVGDLSAVVDTCSSLNFVTERALANVLGPDAGQLPGRVPKVAIRTIHGTQLNTSREVELELSLRVGESWTVPKKERFLVFEEAFIPGGFDLLLSHSWIVECQLVISGQGGRVVVSCAEERERASRSAQTGVEEICCYAFPVDNSEIEDSDTSLDYFEHRDAVKGLREVSLTTGPLTRDQLARIERRVVDEPAAIPIRESLIDPPIRLEGYPMNAEKLCALRVMLDRLEEDGVVSRAARGSGYYTSPGFLVKKGEGKFRLVVDNTALNARLMPSPGAMQASSRAWHESLRSGHNWYGVLDIKDAFFRKEVRESDRKFLHVRFFGIGEYRFNRMPQGLSCSPPYWNALMESILEGIQGLVAEQGARDEELRSRWVRTGVIAYVDDILITGLEPGDVEFVMRVLIQVLGYLNLYVPEAKRQGPSKKVVCLGMQLADGKVGPKDERLAQIRQMPRPCNKDQLRSALGVLNFCRRSVRPVDGLEPLLRLVQKAVPFEWGEEQEKSWKEVVLGIGSIGVDQFSIHDPEEIARHRLFLATDASDLGHGWAVHVIPKDALPADRREVIHLHEYAEVMKTIDIGYTPFRGAELNYSTHDKEGMAMFQLLMRARGMVYLFGEATVISDNIITLSKLRRWGDNESCDTTRSKRWKRWIADLADLLVCRSHGGRCADHAEEETGGHEIHGLVRLQHTSGKDFFLVDWLSRYFLRDTGRVERAVQTGEEVILYMEEQAREEPDALDIPLEVIRWEDDTETEYCGVKLVDIWRSLRRSGTAALGGSERYRNRVSRLSPRFVIDEADRFLYLGGQERLVAVPQVSVQGRSLRNVLIWMVHEGTQLSAHRGMISTAGTLRQAVWWPGMDASVADYIKGCKGCSVAKADSRRAAGSHSQRLLAHPNQLLVVDWAGPFPGRQADSSRFALIMVDAFTGFCHLRGTANKDAASAVEGILEWASSYGFPESWTHDSDPAFTAEAVQLLVRRFGMVDCSGGLTYTPRANGAAERCVRILKECIVAFAPVSGTPTSPSGWGSLLKAVQYCQNSGAYRAMGITPFELMFGRKARGMLETVLGGRPNDMDATDSGSFARELGSRLSELHAYWSRRQTEDRLTLMDENFVLHGPSNLAAGQRCIRVVYVSNRRKVFPGEYVVQGKVAGSTNTYEVTRDGGSSVERVVGYQLIPIASRETTPQAYFGEGMDPPDDAFGSTAMRGKPAGTIIASLYRHKMYIGETTSTYVGGGVIEILFYVPLGELQPERFHYRRPSTVLDIEKAIEIVDVQTVCAVDVVGTWNGNIFAVPSAQFQ